MIEQPSLRDAWNRLQELVQNEYAGCANLAVAMNDVAGAIAAEIVCRAAKEQPGEQKWIPSEEWRLVPSRANVEWSGRLKAKYPGSSNYELQQLINKILDAALKE